MSVSFISPPFGRYIPHELLEGVVRSLNMFDTLLELQLRKYQGFNFGEICEADFRMCIFLIFH